MAIEGLDIIVCNYKTASDLSEFLKSLKTYAPSVPWNLWIANVQPAILDLAVGERWVVEAGAKHLTFQENVGYARACNAASAQGSREVLAIFNADVVLTEGALDDCYEKLLSNKKWGILGPRQIDQARFITSAGVFGTMEHPKMRGWKELDWGNYEDVRDDAVSVSGSAFFVKRSVWDHLTSCPMFQQVDPGAKGAFLQTPHYYEETFCSYHAQAHGYNVVYNGETTIIHKWHQASPLGGWAELQMTASQKLFREACDAHGIEHD